MKKDTFGINMKKYCKSHEEIMTSALSDNEITKELIETHREKIRIVQHERLVHLIVTFLVAILVFFLMDLALLHSELGILPLILSIVALILVGFYLYHYFFLENTLQRWYVILDKAKEILGE